VVLHHISDDAEFVKVASSALSAKRLLEGDEHRGDVVSVPGGVENAVAESNNKITKAINYYNQVDQKLMKI
jgi:hypothetical protein